MADDSHMGASLLKKKQKIKISSAAVVNGTLRAGFWVCQIACDVTKL